MECIRYRQQQQSCRLIRQWYGGGRLLRCVIIALILAATLRPVSANGPFIRTDLSTSSANKPSFVDIDADGDQDAFVGAANETIVFYRNEGSAFSPSFIEQPRAGSPLQSGAALAFVDIDADGDQDAFVGRRTGALTFLRNDGTPQSPSFRLVTPPILSSNVNALRLPTFVDIDADGDQDAFVGTTDGAVAFLRNNGGPTQPRLVEQADSANLLREVDAWQHASPAFVDADGDGDQDAFVSTDTNMILFFHNQGTPTHAKFVPDAGLNPLSHVKLFYANPTFVDIDGDGDIDAFIGKRDGSLDFLRNQGTTTRPWMLYRDGANELLANSKLGGVAANLVDIDADGDLDAFVSTGAQLQYYRNVGTPAQPLLVEQDDSNPTARLHLSDDASPSFVDIDADGDQDLFLGTGFGAVTFCRNSGSPSLPLFNACGPDNPLALVKLDAFASPAFVDLDDDGDQDAVIGARDGRLHVYSNTGSAASPSFVQLVGEASPLDRYDVGSESRPTFTDLDDDGDQDLLVGGWQGVLQLYRNSGTAASATFVEERGEANPFLAISRYNCSPHVALGDLDADGDQDALFLNTCYGDIQFYRNTGTALKPGFRSVPPTDNPFASASPSVGAQPELVDIDADGDHDAFIGRADGTIDFWRNAGSPTAPLLQEQLGQNNPLGSIDAGSSASLAFVDIDADGDQDLFVGNAAGAILFFPNSGAAATPSFGPQGADNPLGAVNTGSYASPTFVDLDADGDQDAFIGQGGIYYQFYRNTGSPTSPILTLVSTDHIPNSSGGLVDLDFADLDGDEDQDLLISTGATVVFKRNTGSPTAPAFSTEEWPANPFAQGVGFTADLVIADINADGYQDVFLVSIDGAIHFYPANFSLTPLMTVEIVTSVPLYHVRSEAVGGLTFVDLDGDDDEDAFMRDSQGMVHLYEHVQTALGEQYIRQPEGDNPLAHFGSERPAFADLDGDGDQDAALPDRLGKLRFLRNTGSPTAAAFTEEVGAANPFAAIDVGMFALPSLVDLDADGDQDAVIVGIPDGFSMLSYDVHFYKNVGGPTHPSFARQPDDSNPFSGITPSSALSFIDIDADADLDAFFTYSTYTSALGAPEHHNHFLHNVGSATSPAFKLETGALNPMSAWLSPVFTDVDLDGDPDAFLASWAHSSPADFQYLENVGSVDIWLLVPELLDAPAPLNQRFTGLASPALVDIDADGDQDMVVASAHEELRFFRNTGGPREPSWTEQTGEENPFGAIDTIYSPRPAFVDIDADGDQDLVLGDSSLTLRFFLNIGTPTTPDLVEQTGQDNPLTTIDVGFTPAPSFGDFDADGDPDLLLGSRDLISYYVNVGTAESASFSWDPEAAQLFSAIDDSAMFNIPQFVDIDGDQDLDLYVGLEDGKVRFYLNLRMPTGQMLFREVNSQRSLEWKDLGMHAQMTFGDVDGDGDLDVVLAGTTDTSTMATSSLVLMKNLNQPPVVKQRTYVPLVAQR